MENYIKHSVDRSLRERKEWLIANKIPVLIINKLPSHVNMESIIHELEENIPDHMLDTIEGIYIGDFKELKERNIQAMFKDGIIYLSSFEGVSEVSEEVIIRDITHELAHALEDKYASEIYPDQSIEKEYEGKKKKLISLLRHQGYIAPEKLFLSDEYVDELDQYLYKEIGYDKLSLIIPGLFTSPYSVTSIREYFANGVEEYLLGDYEHLKDISPVLYRKINSLLEKSF